MTTCLGCISRHKEMAIKSGAELTADKNQKSVNGTHIFNKKYIGGVLSCGKEGTDYSK